MGTTRRGFVMGASAIGLLGVSSGANAQKKEIATATAADSSDFEGALRAIFAKV